MSSKSGGSRLRAALGLVVDTIGTLKGSKPRLVIFAAGFVLLVMAMFLQSYSRLLVLSGVAVLFILVVDLARGGTVAD